MLRKGDIWSRGRSFWVKNDTKVWCGSCHCPAGCQAMEPAEVVDRKGSSGVVLTVFKHYVNTGDKDWLWLKFSFIHYIALDLQKEPRMSEKPSSGFEFGDLGCWFGLRMSNKVCFINMLSPWFPLSLTSTFPSKLSFLQWFPNPTRLWCVGCGSQDLAAEPPHVPRRWCQSHLSFRSRYFPQIYQDPWREPVAELEKISPQKRPDFSQQEICPSGDVVCKPPPTRGVMHNTHANSPGVFQEHFQFPGGFRVFISYRSWCSEPQRPPIQFLRTWACCPWPKNSQISQLAGGIMKTWNKSSLLLISFSLSWLFLYLAIHPMTSLSPFSCGPTPEPTPPFPECPS